MKVTACSYIIVCAMFTSMSLSASQNGLNNFSSLHHSLSNHVQVKTKEGTSRQLPDSTVFYLVNDASTYRGDTLSLGRRNFVTTRSGDESSGIYFMFSNLLLLWDRSQGDFQFVGVDNIENGIWISCWADTPGSAGSCDSTSELVYIFSSETLAASVQSNEQAEPEVQEPEQQPSLVETPAAEESEQPVADESNAIDEPIQSEPDPEPNPAQSDDLEPSTASEITDAAASDELQYSQDIDAVACAAPSEAFKAALLQATNNSRAEARSCGTNAYPVAPALVWNNSLARTAQRHSEDMSSNNFFSHSGSDGLQVWDRANAENYQYRYIGENIAAGQRTVGQVQNGWIDSPGHCANIMNQQIVEMGAACVVDANSDYGTYWTVVVGEPQ